MDVIAKLSQKEKLAIKVASLGMFLSTLDSGIINVALPTLQNYFNDTVTNISWTISLYLIILSSTIFIFGKLSDRYGRVAIFRIGLIIFCLGSILCGL
jgi:MFS family permease